MSSPSKKIHKWTEAQRTVLSLLNTHFDLDIDTRTQIFNIVSKDELDAGGIHEGLSSAQLKSQWRDRKHKGREHLWRSTFQAPQSEAEEAVREGLVKRIHDAAATLGVSTEGRVVAGSGAGDDIGQGTSAQELVDLPSSRHLHNALRKLGMNGKPTTLSEKVTGYDDRESGYAGIDEEVPGSADEEESPAAEEEADDGDYVEASTRKPKAATSKRHEGALKMLHTKDVSWNVEEASIKSLDGATVAHTSSYYKHGGEVRRITVQSDNTEVDFMVCDAGICPACSDPSAPLVLAPDEALPFIHSSDTSIIQRRTYFTPRSKEKPQGKLPKTFLRYVQFRGLNGDVAAWVRVCGFVGCEVCMAGKSGTNGDDGGSKLEGGDEEDYEVV